MRLPGLESHTEPEGHIGLSTHSQASFKYAYKDAHKGLAANQGVHTYAERYSEKHMPWGKDCQRLYSIWGKKEIVIYFRREMSVNKTLFSL